MTTIDGKSLNYYHRNRESILAKAKEKRQKEKEREEENTKLVKEELSKLKEQIRKQHYNREYYLKHKDELLPRLKEHAKERKQLIKEKRKGEFLITAKELDRRQREKRVAELMELVKAF